MQNLSNRFWKKYLATDILKQQELLSTLPLLKELAKNGFPNISKSKPELSKKELVKEQEKFNSYMLTTMLLSYIEDLLETIDIKKEEKKKKNNIVFNREDFKKVINSKDFIKEALKVRKGDVIIFDEGKKSKNTKSKSTKLVCKICKKEIDHPRRRMCLNCYRKTTGLSKGKKS